MTITDPTNRHLQEPLRLGRFHTTRCHQLLIVQVVSEWSDTRVSLTFWCVSEMNRPVLISVSAG